MKLLVHRLNKDAVLPERKTTNAAGYDLYSCHNVTILPRQHNVVSTGIAVRLPVVPRPFKVYGSIRNRSSLSFNKQLEVGGGVVDYDYSGEIKVILYNLSENTIEIPIHSRIAQLILEIYIDPLVEEVSELPPIDTDRTGGFGSTGV